MILRIRKITFPNWQMKVSLEIPAVLRFREEQVQIGVDDGGEACFDE